MTQSAVALLALTLFAARRLFESYGLVLEEWGKARTDWVTLREYPPANVELA